jgi:hypothetical protein
MPSGARSSERNAHWRPASQARLPASTQSDMQRQTDRTPGAFSTTVQFSECARCARGPPNCDSSPWRRSPTPAGSVVPSSKAGTAPESLRRDHELSLGHSAADAPVHLSLDRPLRCRSNVPVNSPTRSLPSPTELRRLLRRQPADSFTVDACRAPAAPASVPRPITHIATGSTSTLNRSRWPTPPAYPWTVVSRCPEEMKKRLTRIDPRRRTMRSWRSGLRRSRSYSDDQSSSLAALPRTGDDPGVGAVG